ncbi:hypothetical protein Gotur_009807 [Gossypium turneri]
MECVRLGSPPLYQCAYEFRVKLTPPTYKGHMPKTSFPQIGGLGAAGDNKPGPTSASKASIEAMPRIKVEESGKDCGICLQEFEVEEEAREMPCKHVFHSGCIEKWLLNH